MALAAEVRLDPLPSGVINYRVMSCDWARALGSRPAVVGLALLAASGCPGRLARQAVAVAPAVPPAEVTLGALQLLTDRMMTLPPDRFEPTGRLFGLEDGERCQVFRTDGSGYLGEYPVAACKAWPAALRQRGASLDELQPREQAVEAGAVDLHLASPKGTGEAVWRGAELQVWGGSLPLSRYVPRCSGPCRPITAVAWSPDGEQLALAHNADPRVLVIRARDGATARELPLAPGTAVLPGMLAWSPSGLVAVAGKVVRSEAEPLVELGSEEWTLTKKRLPPLRAYLFGQKGRLATLAIDDVETDSNGVTLDPAGRYLFISGSGRRAVRSLEGYELRSGIERSFYFRTPESTGKPARTETVRSAWLPGAHPLWETIEAHVPEEGERTYTAWRFYTRPALDGPRLERIELVEPPLRCESRRVSSDGRMVGPADPSDTYDSCGRNALDPSGRLRGLAKDEIQRVDDGVRLRAGPRGCLTTDTGFYSCLLLASERRYVVGTDPLHVLMLRGDQLAPLFFRTELLTEYLAGQPLAAPSKDLVLGLPPGLRVESVTPGAAAGRPPEVTIEVTDGGSGLGQLQLYRDGEALGPPTALRVGRQVVPLPQLGRSCHELRAYACNWAGRLCSPAVPIAPCKAGSAQDDSE